MHRIQDTDPLSHFRQHTSDHLKRIAKGTIEMITQNAEAAKVVMSSERYDPLAHQIERGHLWSQALARIGRELGEDAQKVLQRVARDLNIQL